MGLYKYLRQAWKQPTEEQEAVQTERLLKFRTENSTTRVEYPTRLDRARSLGYKAKPGVFIVRQRIIKGGHSRPDRSGGRRTAHSGHWMTLSKNYQHVCEERAARKYVGCEVLNSYYVAEDGKHIWYEIIMVDPVVVAHDKDLGWMIAPQHRGRTFRGLTSAGKKSRGLRNKGKGAEKVRPTQKAHGRRVK